MKSGFVDGNHLHSEKQCAIIYKTAMMKATIPFSFQRVCGRCEQTGTTILPPSESWVKARGTPRTACLRGLRAMWVVPRINPSHTCMRMGLFLRYRKVRSYNAKKCSARMRTRAKRIMSLGRPHSAQEFRRRNSLLPHTDFIFSGGKRNVGFKVCQRESGDR